MKNIIFILDASYSSTLYIKHYLNTINAVVENLKKTDKESLLSVISFNTSYFIHRFFEPVLNFKQLSLEEVKCSDMTALYDSVGAILVHLEKFYKKTERKDEPLIVLFTDGDDNSSKILKPLHIFLQVSRLRNINWKFLYLNTSKETVSLGKNMAFNGNILYDSTDKCFEKINQVIFTLIENDRALKTGKSFESDLTEVENSLANVKI